MPNTNYATDLLSTTFEVFYRTRPSDAIFGEFVLWRTLADKNKISKQGGSKILTPIMYRKSTAVFSYSGYDLFDMTPQDVVTNAEFDWKFYGGTVVIDNPTHLMNRGDKAILNILKTRTQQAETSLADKMNQDSFLDGTGNSSKNVTGLALMVDSAGTYGNIARASNSWWGAQETAVSGTLAIRGSTGMARMYNDCGLGPKRQVPDLIITDQDEFEAYEALQDPYIRYTVAPVGGKMNVVNAEQNLMFRKAMVEWDDYCQSGVMYFLNTERIAVVELEGRGAEVEEDLIESDQGSFRVSKFVEPHNQDAQSAKIRWAGNYVADNCIRLGKLTGLTD